MPTWCALYATACRVHLRIPAHPSLYFILYISRTHFHPKYLLHFSTKVQAYIYIHRALVLSTYLCTEYPSPTTYCLCTYYYAFTHFTRRLTYACIRSRHLLFTLFILQTGWLGLLLVGHLDAIAWFWISQSRCTLYIEYLVSAFHSYWGTWGTWVQYIWPVLAIYKDILLFLSTLSVPGWLR